MDRSFELSFVFIIFGLAALLRKPLLKWIQVGNKIRPPGLKLPTNEGWLDLYQWFGVGLLVVGALNLLFNYGK